MIKVPVEVTKPCELPPRPELPVAKTSICPEGSNLAICYDLHNGRNLLLAVSRLKHWLDETIAACSDKPKTFP
jgi:hypothetical protein